MEALVGISLSLPITAYDTFFPMANGVMKRHVSHGDLNNPHQQKSPDSTYWQSIMGNKKAPDIIFSPVISD